MLLKGGYGTAGGLASVARGCSHLVEDPDLAVHRGPGHPVAVVVEEDPLLLGIPA